MNQHKSFAYLILFMTMVLVMMCDLPLDPGKNPEYAGIDEENISTLPSNAPMGSFYNCTLTVFLPSLIDSFTVKKSTGTITSMIASGDSVGDTLLFTLDFLQPDDYTIDIVLYKAEFIDTLRKKISIYSTVPTSLFSKTTFSMNYGQNISLPFTLLDPDSNLLAYYVNYNGIRIDTVDIKVANRAFLEATILPASNTDLQKVNYYSIEAFDVDSQFSRNVVCTLTIADTVFPKVSMVNIIVDSAFTVATLPCTLGVLVSDNWYIDSIKVSGFHRSLPDRDTLKIIKTHLNPGVTTDSIEVWDRGANRTVLKFALKYNGIVTYPPVLRPITIKPVFERDKFDTLFLDTIVTITDTAATYNKEALVWTIAVDTYDSLIKYEYDPAKRKLYVDVPNSETGYDRLLSLTITVTDPNGKSDKLERASFWVIEKNDPPVVKINNQVKVFGAAFDTLILDKCGYDSDPGDRINWKIEAGKYFKPDSIYSPLRAVTLKATDIVKIPIRYFTGKVAIVPDTTKFKPATVPLATAEIVDSIKFTASDGELSTELYVKFTWRRLPIIKTDEILIDPGQFQ